MKEHTQKRSVSLSPCTYAVDPRRLAHDVVCEGQRGKKTAKLGVSRRKECVSSARLPACVWHHAFPLVAAARDASAIPTRLFVSHRFGGLDDPTHSPHTDLATWDS